MKFATPLLAVSLVFGGASASSVLDEDAFFGTLMRRQELGTPKGNCHDNCGTAITQSKSLPNPCTSTAFTTNYANCLQCAGPDNQNIWRYYGNTLKAAGSKCGLETEPKSGKQDDVPLAIKEETSSTTSAPAVSSTAAAVTSAVETSVAASSSAPASTTPVVPISSGTAAAVPTVSLPGASSNTSATTPTVAIQTTNAAVSNFGGSAGAMAMFGAVVLGAMGLN